MTKMSAKRHLKELQWRFMLVALFFIAGAVLAYTYRDTILPIFLGPLNGQKLIYLTPGGGFTFALLVSVYAGLAVAFPVLLQQLYSFLSPAFPEKARKKSAVILVSSFFLLVAGILFGYFVAVPSALTFLYGFADQYVESALTADSYTNFVVAYTIGIGIVFQVPLLLLLLHAIKPLKPGGLMKSEKWVVLGAFIVAAILTPTPDPINQAIMAGPVIVVYQLGVIAVLISIGSTAQKLKKQARAEAKAAEAAWVPTPLQELASPEHALAAEAAATESQTTEPLVETPSLLAFETADEEVETRADLETAFEFEADDPISHTTPVIETREPITESFEVIAEPTELEAPALDTPLVEAIEAEAEADLGIERTVSADLDALPTTPLTTLEPVSEPILPLAEVVKTQPKVIDGFTRRPAGQIQVPQRPVQGLKPQPRPTPAPLKPGPARGFYVDGIIAPRVA